MTFKRLLLCNRVAALISAGLACTLLIGPFSGLETWFGLNDFQAHVVLFFFLSLMVFTVAPTYRRGDLALGILAFGMVIELVQSVTGRSLSLTDWLGDAIGICAAVIPGSVERLRKLTREVPFAPVSSYNRRVSSARPWRPSPASGASGQRGLQLD